MGKAIIAAKFIEYKPSSPSDTAATNPLLMNVIITQCGSFIWLNLNATGEVCVNRFKTCRAIIAFIKNRVIQKMPISAGAVFTNVCFIYSSWFPTSGLIATFFSIRAFWYVTMIDSAVSVSTACVFSFC